MFKKVLSLLALEVFLIIGFNYEDVKCFAATDFSDVPISHMYYEDITYMRENGYVSGYGDNTFKPDRDVTLLETAVMLKKKSLSVVRPSVMHIHTVTLVMTITATLFARLTKLKVINILMNAAQLSIF